MPGERKLAEAGRSSGGGHVTMEKKGCSGGNSRIPGESRGSGTFPLYWCETCQQFMLEKRCPKCGLKCRKVRQPDQQEVVP